MINKDQFTPQAWLRTPEDMGVANHIKKRYEDTQEESAVREWTGKDSIVTQKSLQSTPLTPEQAGEEDGWLDKMLDGTSDAVVGLYRGIGYGIDELAVSASELANMFTDEDTTYQAKYISKYMDTMKRKGVAGDVAESIGQFMIGWMPWTRGIGLMAKGMQGVGLTKKAGVALAGGSKAGRISSNFIASSLAGGTAFSPDHESIVDALTTLDRKSQGAIARILATNPNDPDWKNRARHALTDGLGSLAGDLLLVPAVKGVGGAIAGVAKDPLDKFIQGLHTYTHKVAKDVSDRYGVLGRGKTHVYVEDGTTKFRNADGNVQLDEFADKMKMPNIKPNGDNAESVLRQMEKDGSLDAKFAEARTLEEKSLLADQIAEQLGRKRNLKLGSVEVGNIKWNKGKGGGFHTTVDGKKWSIKLVFESKKKLYMDTQIIFGME